MKRYSTCASFTVAFTEKNRLVHSCENWILRSWNHQTTITPPQSTVRRTNNEWAPAPSPPKKHRDHAGLSTLQEHTVWHKSSRKNQIPARYRGLTWAVTYPQDASPISMVWIAGNAPAWKRNQFASEAAWDLLRSAWESVVTAFNLHQFRYTDQFRTQVTDKSVFFFFLEPSAPPILGLLKTSIKII